MNALNLPKIFDHLRNGELIHDCYYDIENSNKKIVFINDMHYIKYDADGQPVLTKLGDLNIDERLLNINLCRGTRKLSYVQFVKRTFAYYMIF